MDPRLAMEDCYIENGKQCYSSGNAVTFIFTPNWREPQSTGSVELFLLATSKEHAVSLVKGG